MRRVFWVAVLVSLPLLGCETLGLTRRDPSMIVDPGPMCPSGAILADAASVTKFKPGAAAPANVALTAEMSQAKITCSYDQVKNTLSVNVNFDVHGTRGPGSMGADPSLDFFVAVVDVDGNVLAKKVYQNQPDLGGKPDGKWTQRVADFVVPISMDKRPYDYEILTGFQLSPAELAYNRTPKSVPARP